MNNYFLAIIIIECLSLGLVLARHGEKHEGKYNFIISLVSTVIMLILTYLAIKTGF